jgi:ribose 5-phosphate isomerase RpiB
MKIALAADHGGFDMKQVLIERLRTAPLSIRPARARRPFDASVDHTEARCHSGTPGGLPGSVRPPSF